MIQKEILDKIINLCKNINDIKNKSDNIVSIEIDYDGNIELHNNMGEWRNFTDIDELRKEFLSLKKIININNSITKISFGFFPLFKNEIIQIQISATQKEILELSKYYNTPIINKIDYYKCCGVIINDMSIFTLIN